MSDAGKLLRAIERANDGVYSAHDKLAQAVEHARDGGCTWDAIGQVLGITRQAAHERFGPPSRDA